MSSQNRKYPQTEIPSSSSFNTSSLDTRGLTENQFQNSETTTPSTMSMPTGSWEEILVKIPGTIVHLIDKEASVELACGEFEIVRLWQGRLVVATLARVGDKIQWPLAKDEAAVKLDGSHYFFNLRVPFSSNRAYSSDDDEIVVVEREGCGQDFLNYSLTIASKGQEELVKELDGVLEYYSNYSVQKVNNKVGESSEELVREMMEERSAAYWATLATNVEDYGSSVARMIAAGSAQLSKGILWCGDVTVDRLKWGDEFLKERMGPAGSKPEISPEAFRRIERIRSLTKLSEDVATEVFSGVVQVSGFVTSSIVNSSVGKKFCSQLLGEIVLASLDGCSKVFDAIEVAGKNVMSTTSVVTTELVSQRYGEAAAQATNQGLDAAGHAIGTVWAVFKIREAIKPKSVIKPTTLAKAAAEGNSGDLNAKYGKHQ